MCGLFSAFNFLIYSTQVVECILDHRANVGWCSSLALLDARDRLFLNSVFDENVHCHSFFFGIIGSFPVRKVVFPDFERNIPEETPPIERYCNLALSSPSYMNSERNEIENAFFCIRKE